MLKFIFSFFFLFYFGYANANDSFLTLKQQIDRMQREINDISKLVFTESENNEIDSKIIINKNSDLTAFDLRIYDLEKDIKKINNNFEELIFKFDDLLDLFINLELEFSNFSFDNKFSQIDTLVKDVSIDNNNEDLLIKEENSLGTIVISSEDLSKNNVENSLEIDNKDEKKLSAQEEYQLAYDMIRNQQFENAKEAFVEFINVFKDHELTGSAHYWLGEMYLLNNEYKEAALILAEGYQKFPISIKSPDMLYKLSEALIIMNKNDEACTTLKKFTNQFPNHKLLKKTESKINSLECSNLD